MSKIEIINRALLKLGEPPISSLNDGQFGRAYDLIYHDVKNLLLSSYPWRFAVGRQSLAPLVEKYGERYKYQMPNDCLFLIKVFNLKQGYDEQAQNAVQVNYEICNKTIVCDVKDEIEIEYVKAIDDEGEFTPLFREAMVAKLAAELTMRIKQSISFKQAFENEFFNLIRQAELNNEIMKSAEILPDSSWVRIRQAW